MTMEELKNVKRYGLGTVQHFADWDPETTIVEKPDGEYVRFADVFQMCLENPSPEARAVGHTPAVDSGGER